MAPLTALVQTLWHLLLLLCIYSNAESVAVSSMSAPNSLLVGGRWGGTTQGRTSPRLFLQGNHTEVAAQVGATAQLHCQLTGALADGMVSWVRRRDYHLLTVGRHVYTSDDRVAVKVSPDASDWMLTLRWVREGDAGQYECQVSSHPPQALMINLKVKVAWAEIQGESERYIHSGSALRLVCVLRDITEQPSYVFWFREGRMINYDTKTGVSVKTLKGSSVLLVRSVTRRDEGNYSCVASNTTPASVTVHVVQKENPAGLQQETNTEKESSVSTNIAAKSSSTSTRGKAVNRTSKTPQPAAAATSSAVRFHPPLHSFLTAILNFGSWILDFGMELCCITSNRPGQSLLATALRTNDGGTEEMSLTGFSDDGLVVKVVVTYVTSYYKLNGLILTSSYSEMDAVLHAISMTKQCTAELIICVCILILTFICFKSALLVYFYFIKDNCQAALEYFNEIMAGFQIPTFEISCNRSITLQSSHSHLGFTLFR